MKNPASSPIPITTGPVTGPVLGFIVFLCLVLIGAAGYMKFELDRAEARLAAPDSAIASDQKALYDLGRTLGYSGFVGSARDFLATGNHADLADMKAQLRMADDMIVRLPQKTPPEARHDLEAITAAFAAVLHKADQPGAGVPAGFTQADLAPLYAALPVIDARVESALATARLASAQQLKFWAMLLIFVAWTSLVIASSCAAGIYLSLRSRHAAPLRALAQSVRNMSRGDMHTPIWGLERSDMVGEVARAADLARYHFSQLPDMTLMSEQGPVRIRFEGNTRSLFEAMMQHIAHDSERVREQATGLTEAIVKQKESIAHISGRVEIALENMQKQRAGGEEEIHRLMQTISASAQSLQKAQEYAAAQLGRLSGTMQERVHGLTELTQITGKQVAQTLQALDRDEHNLRLSVEHNQQTVQRMASSADDLSDRMASATALLRAGGKVLNETAEATQSRLNEAVGLLGKSESDLRQIIATGGRPADTRAPEDEDALQRLKTVAANLEVAQQKLDECLAQQTRATGAQIDLLTTQSNSLLTQASTAAQSFASAADRLRDEQDKLAQTVERAGGALEERLASGFDRRLAELSAKVEPIAVQLVTLGQLTDALGSVAATLGPLNPSVVAGQGNATENLMTEVKAGFEITQRSIARIREEFLGHLLKQSPAESALAAAQGQWDKIAAQIETVRSNLTESLVRTTDRIETHLVALDQKTARGEKPAEDTQAQLQQQAQILSELAAALGAIDAHMQEIERHLHSA